MTLTLSKWKSIFSLLAVLGVFVSFMAFTPSLSNAQSPSTAITIQNSSSREIRHVYLSTPDSNTWGPDQLVNSVIPANGGSFTITGVSCNGAGVKVIAEDNEGCFLYQVVTCSEAVTWTISNDTTRDCGS